MSDTAQHWELLWREVQAKGVWAQTGKRTVRVLTAKRSTRLVLP